MPHASNSPRRLRLVLAACLFAFTASAARAADTVSISTAGG
jgi:hypothetical protein